MFAAIMRIVQPPNSEIQPVDHRQQLTFPGSSERKPHVRFFEDEDEFHTGSRHDEDGSRVKGGSVACVPAARCSKQNVYGTDPDHFLQFGFISPSENKCFS